MQRIKRCDMFLKKEKTRCEDCKNFVWHYAIIDGEFVKVGCGHCVSNFLSPRYRKKCPITVNCRGWETAGGKEEEKRL